MSVKALYDGTPRSSWIKLLSRYDMHYHFGMKGKFDNPFANSIEAIRPWLGKHVLDLGAGYGGPARFLNQHNHKVTAVSNSATQMKYIQLNSVNINCVEHDLNEGLLQINFPVDSFLMCESFSHIKNQIRLLEEIRAQNRPLILIAHATHLPSFYHTNWHMQFHNVQRLLSLFEQLGFKVEHCVDLMPEKALVTAQKWSEALALTPKRYWLLHWEMLHSLSQEILNDKAGFIEQFALLNIKCVPN